MNHRRIAVTAGAFFLLFFWVVAWVSESRAGTSDTQMDQIHAKKQVTFYHTYGYKEKETWVVPMRAWVHEKAGMMRRISAELAMEAMEEKTGMAELNQLEKDLFMSRIKDFIADSESNDFVIFKFDNDPDKKKYQITSKTKPSKTDHNGLIEGDIRLSQDIVDRLISSQNTGQLLRFQAVSKNHMGVGYITIIPPKGLSVISDIDDTVKITQIPDGESMILKNTFFRHFVAAPCMAHMYNTFGKDTVFHYVSGGPWQMYQPIYDFLFSKYPGFPRGSFHMKNLRTNPLESESYKNFWTLIANGSMQATFDQKMAQIRTLLKHFPERKFILIGDNGEKDPEVYRRIQKEFPYQIQEIRIRVVADNKDNPGRLDRMTRIPPEKEDGVTCSEFINTF